MPRLKPYRACKLLLYLWLSAVAFWSLLPSPTIRYEQERLHNEEMLKAGFPLTFIDSYAMILNKEDSQGRFIFKWQVLRHLTLQNEVELVLKVAENTPINLAELMKRSESFHFSKTKNNAVRTPFFDPTRLEFEVPWIDDIDCSGVCLPWFDRNDKAMLTHDMHGGSSSIRLRLVVDERGVVELWPASFVENALAELEQVRKKPEAASYEEGQLLEEALEFLRDSGRPLIQLEGGDMTKWEEITVPYVRGNLPSKSYHIRKALLTRLGFAVHVALFPLVLLVSLLSDVPQAVLLILFQGGLACAGITLSCWLRDGRPEFLAWSRTFWMTRWMYWRTQKAKRVWGPAGPVESKRTERNEYAGSRIIGLNKPQTARLGRGWDAV